MPTNFSSEQYKQLNKQVTPPAATFERLQKSTPSTTSKASAAPILNNLPTTPSKSQNKHQNSLLTGIKSLPFEAAKFEKKRGAGMIALALGTLIIGSYTYTIKSMKQENFADVVIPDTLKLKE